MSGQTSWPVPTGVGASFSNVVANANTPTFYMPPGPVVITFQPADPNNPGTLTLYSSTGTSLLTMNAIGYANYVVAGEAGIETAGASFYFSCTQPMNLVAMTRPQAGWR